MHIGLSEAYVLFVGSFGNGIFYVLCRVFHSVFDVVRCVGDCFLGFFDSVRGGSLDVLCGVGNGVGGFFCIFLSIGDDTLELCVLIGIEALLP